MPLGRPTLADRIRRTATPDVIERTIIADMPLRRGRGSDPQDQDRSALQCPVTEAQAYLDSRIEAGRQLATEPLRSRDELDDLWRRVEQWRDVNRSWLDMNLGGEAAEEYRAASAHMFTTRGSVRPDRELGILRREVGDEISKLQSISERLVMWSSDAEKQPAAIGSVQSDSDVPVNRVFFGHGRSGLWRELKDFIHDRLGLEFEEFNRVAVAGMGVAERLSEMLDNSSMAFIICTAEDEHADGTQHARENVIHEAGLFQGRLGFRRAIVLLEEGCAEFSNIHGLNQIRFPAGNISACFEEIRQVFERERLLPS
jgi:hypothetical protein